MFKKIKELLKVTWEELIHKVTWPSWDELQSSAVITLVASLIIAVLVFIMDAVFENVVKLFYSIFS